MAKANPAKSAKSGKTAKPAAPTKPTPQKKQVTNTKKPEAVSKDNTKGRIVGRKSQDNSVATTALTNVESVAQLETDQNAVTNKTDTEKVQAGRRGKVEEGRVTKFIFFSTFILATFMGIGATCKWGLFYLEFGIPPSVYSSDAHSHAILAFVGLFLLAPFGLIILAKRIGNMFVGVVFMFCIVLVLSFGMTGVSRGCYSIKHDSISEFKVYYKQIFRDEKTVPEFYNKVQKRCQCCGFKRMDRLEDWPKSLQTPDFPKGCCKRPNTCTGLGRMWDQPRVPSGFTAILPLKEGLVPERINLEKFWSDKSPGQDYNLAPIQAEFGTGASRRYVASLVIGMFEDLQRSTGGQGYDIGPVGNAFYKFSKSQIKEARVDDENDGLREATAPPELLVKLDTMVEFIAYNNVSKINRGEWIAIQLPVYLAASTIKGNVLHTDDDEGFFGLFYFTKGLLENTIFLQNDLIWERRCEAKLDIDDFETCNYYTGDPKIKEAALRNPENLETQIVDWIKTISSASDDYVTSIFVTIVHEEMWWIAAMAGAVIGFVLILGLIFWYYYSHLKAEEQAVQSVSKDYDLRDLNLLTYEELDEETKAKERALLKIRKAERAERIRYEHHGHAGNSKPAEVKKQPIANNNTDKVTKEESNNKKSAPIFKSSKVAPEKPLTKPK